MLSPLLKLVGEITDAPFHASNDCLDAREFGIAFSFQEVSEILEPRIDRSDAAVKLAQCFLLCLVGAMPESW